MKIPILKNARAVLRGQDEGEEVEPDIATVGLGDELDEDEVQRLVEELTDLTNRLPRNDAGRRAFDQQAAVLLAEYLPLQRGDAAEKRFWQWLAVTQAREVVRWRWAHLGKIAENRWMGGWKDTFRRLWLRSQIVHEPGRSAPFELARRGDEDFWVGIIEREIAECATLVRVLVRAFFPSNRESSRASKQRMEHYRSTIKRLRQIRPCRVFERMNEEEVQALVEQTMNAAVPVRPESGGRPRRVRRSRARISSRAARRRSPGA
jgi:hypothetical protein